jgi:coenzyme F420-reducing hydrogenase beta subunit
VDPLLAERLTCFVGLVCGHLKSTRFADLLAWQLGIEPGSLRAFDFRRKLEHLPANRYGVEATGTRDGRTSTTSAPANDLLGADWGHGFFKYKACDFCDDVFAEVADIVIGDAWLPRYSQDWQGTNVVLVRRRDLDEIVRAAAAEGRLHLEPITAEDAAHSQAAGLRHRRDGLRYRLELAGRRGEWAPPKRVEPGSRHLTRSARARFRLRERMRDRSHEEFARTLADGDLSRFTRRMLRLVAAYRRAGLSPLERLRDTAAYVARGIAVRLRRLGSGPAPLPGNE